ncbi:50S ribosomal protein L9 [Propioniciclava flava]|uniref:Large ribosomal subunit protein bL9 n=1 Tax=Propioniciclava flava TaxID=2072026 RepID=A0A4Q2EFU7_9ACTN|nr:50S ribosomal protein L9 [Propioniciclava flava]RXW31412.1 50S ribosomal protein L9 [Propioniciclava flava]
MKLILTAAVDHLGIAGDIVEVKDGFGRNYLLPQGFAIRWTRGAEKQIEGINRAREARTVRDHAHAGEIRTQLEALEIQVPARVSPEGKLFGAITAADIASAIKKANGPAIDRRNVVINKPIKSVGEHKVGVKLTDAVTAHVPVKVVAA